VVTAPPAGPVQEVPLERIEADATFQIRLDPRPGQLLRAIEADGQLVPVALQARGERLRVIDGFRRVAVLRRLERPSVRAMVFRVGDAEALRLSYVFNSARKTLLPEDRWNSLRRMAQELGWSNARIAEATGLHPNTVSRLRNLFPAIPLVRDGIEEGWLRPAHLKALRALLPRDRWPDWLRRVRDERLSGRSLLDLVGAEQRRREPPYVAREPGGALVVRGFRFDPATASAEEMWRAVEQVDEAIDRIRSWLRRQRR
jgi:ParB-like chromosome segregation protein Spo0J